MKKIITDTLLVPSSLKSQGVKPEFLTINELLPYRDELTQAFKSLTHPILPECVWIGVIDHDKNIKLLVRSNILLDILAIAAYFKTVNLPYNKNFQKNTLEINGNLLFDASYIDRVFSENSRQILSEHYSQKLALQLQEAIMKGELEKVRDYVEGSGANINNEFPNGDLPLCEAIANVQIYQYLRNRGAKFSLNFLFIDFFDALSRCVDDVQQLRSVYQHLMEDYELQIEDKDTYIHLIGMQGNLQYLEEIYQSEGNEEFLQSSAIFYLLLGELLGNTEKNGQLAQIATFLQNPSCPIAEQNIFGNPLAFLFIDLVVKCDRIDMIRFCLDEELISIDTQFVTHIDRTTTSLMKAAVISGSSQLIDLLVDVYAMDPCGMINLHWLNIEDELVPLLYLAASADNISTLQALVRAIEKTGKDIHKTPPTGKYAGMSLPYYRVLCKGQNVVNVLRELQQLGFDMNQQNPAGTDRMKTPFDGAIFLDDAKIAAYLIEECGVIIPHQNFGEKLTKYLMNYSEETFNKLQVFCSKLDVRASLGKEHPHSLIKQVALSGSGETTQLLLHYLRFDCKVDNLHKNTSCLQGSSNVTYLLLLHFANLHYLNLPKTFSAENLSKLLGMREIKDDILAALKTINLSGGMGTALSTSRLIFEFKDTISKNQRHKIQQFFAFLSFRYPELKIEPHENQYLLTAKNEEKKLYEIPGFIDISKQHGCGSLVAAAKLCGASSAKSPAINWEVEYPKIQLKFAGRILKLIQENKLDAIRDFLACGDWRINQPLFKAKNLFDYANEISNSVVAKLALELGAKPTQKEIATKPPKNHFPLITPKEDYSALYNILNKFTCGTYLNLEWKKEVSSNVIIFSAMPACNISCGLLRDYFRSFGLKCDWLSGDKLCVDAQTLSEIRKANQKILSPEDADRLKDSRQLLNLLLRLARPLLLYADWQVTTDGYTTSVNLDVKNLSMRISNVEYFFQYILQQCGLPFNTTLIHVNKYFEGENNSGQLSIRYELLLHQNIQQLCWKFNVESQLLLGKLKDAAQDLSQLSRQLTSFADLLQTLHLAEQARERSKPKRQDEESQSRLAIAKPKKEEKNQHKFKQIKIKARRTAPKEAKSDNDKLRENTNIAPQDPKRRGDIRALPTAAYVAVASAVEHDFTRPNQDNQQFLNAHQASIANVLGNKPQRWQENALGQQLHYISGMIKHKIDYLISNHECRPVGHRALLYYIRRLHLVLDKETQCKFSRRFHSLILHAYFRVNPFQLFEFAEICYAQNNLTLNTVRNLADSWFYKKINDNMPDNLYNIERSLADREKDLHCEIENIKSYCKILDEGNILQNPEYVCAARMSIMIIGEIWNRIRNLFNFSQLDADWLSYLHCCSGHIRNIEEHVVDQEAHQDSAKADGGFEVHVTSDFEVVTIARRLASKIKIEPNLIQGMFLLLAPPEAASVVLHSHM